jgi:polyisoprenoid-binding protein YceI
MRTAVVVRAAALGLACAAGGTTAVAAPVTYEIDSDHTYPTFEADHLGGLSKWRGKINSTSGTILLDKQARSGTVNVTMDMTTIDFGHDGLNEHAQTPDIFDTAKYPRATYTGTLADFRSGAPTKVDGTLTMHGVSRPVTLNVTQFTCKQHPMLMREVCGADAEADINRSDFGITIGQGMFDMGVKLRISIEAIVPES